VRRSPIGATRRFAWRWNGLCAPAKLSFEELSGVDAIPPIVITALYILASSLLKEPSRRNFNAIMIGVAGAAYLSGGFGVWEFVFTGTIWNGVVSRRVVVRPPCLVHHRNAHRDYLISSRQRRGFEASPLLLTFVNASYASGSCSVAVA
jgi:hypothetical protein